MRPGPVGDDDRGEKGEEVAPHLGDLVGDRHGRILASVRRAGSAGRPRGSSRVAALRRRAAARRPAALFVGRLLLDVRRRRRAGVADRRRRQLGPLEPADQPLRARPSGRPSCGASPGGRGRRSRRGPSRRRARPCPTTSSRGRRARGSPRRPSAGRCSGPSGRPRSARRARPTPWARRRPARSTCPVGSRRATGR